MQLHYTDFKQSYQSSIREHVPRRDDVGLTALLLRINPIPDG